MYTAREQELFRDGSKSVKERRDDSWLEEEPEVLRVIGLEKLGGGT